MKQLILGTPLGRLAMSLRRSLTCARSAVSSPEAVGTIANDFLAGDLAPRLCRPNKTFIDVGAHIGSVVADVAHYCPTARIVAFEAIPEKADRLRRKFPRIECHCCALSDAEGEASFFVYNDASGFSSLGRPPAGSGSGSSAPNVTEIKVRLKRLDDLISSADVDVVKIDVEGAELGVLRGAERLVADSRPTIMFESGPKNDDGLDYTKEALWQWFADRRYAVVVPNRLAHDGPGLSLEGFVESHLYPRRTTNYFAVALERRIELRDRARAVLDVPAS